MDSFMVPTMMLLPTIKVRTGLEIRSIVVDSLWLLLKKIIWLSLVVTMMRCSPIKKPVHKIYTGTPGRSYYCKRKRNMKQYNSWCIFKWQNGFENDIYLLLNFEALAVKNAKFFTFCSSNNLTRSWVSLERYVDSCQTSWGIYLRQLFDSTC